MSDADIKPPRRDRGFARGFLVDTQTGEKQLLFEGPTVTGAEIVEADFKRAGRASDLRFVFEFIVGLPVTPARILALHKIITRSPRWLEFDGKETLNRYLHRAVLREGNKIQRAWESDGVLPPEARRKEAKAARRMERSREPGPMTSILRKEASARWREFIVRLRTIASERDRQVLDLMEQGYEPAEAMRLLGLPWSAWQSLQRKARRLRDRAKKKRADSSS